MSDLLPLFPLDLVLFPETLLPLHIFEPRYREMAAQCLRDKKEFGIVRALAEASEGESDSDENEEPGESRLAKIGCTAEIIDVLRSYPDGRSDILVRGKRRFELVSVDTDRSYLRGEVIYFDDDRETSSDADLRGRVVALHHQVLLITSTQSSGVEEDDPFVSFQLGAALTVDLEFKQSLLQLRSERQRLKVLEQYYSKVIPKLKAIVIGRKKAGSNGLVH